jgi:hypothetical protein
VRGRRGQVALVARQGRRMPAAPRDAARQTGWVGKSNALGRLIFYLLRASWGLVNYASRRAQRLPISSAGAESVVDHLVGQRMKPNGHMRWTRRGARKDVIRVDREEPTGAPRDANQGRARRPDDLFADPTRPATALSRPGEGAEASRIG